FELSDNQAEAILNMRLRSLRKLEEIELRTEHKTLSEEQAHLNALLASDRKQWGEITRQIGELKKLYGPGTPLGARKTQFGELPDSSLAEVSEAAMIEREPITVILSEKGWIR